MRAKVTDCVVHPSGRVMVIALEDKPFLMLVKLPGFSRIWDIANYTKSRHLGKVCGARFLHPSKDKWVVTVVSEDGWLRFFDMNTGHQEREISLPGGFTEN